MREFLRVVCTRNIGVRLFVFLYSEYRKVRKVRSSRVANPCSISPKVTSFCMKKNCMRQSTGQDTTGTLENENILLISDVIELYQKKGLPGMLLFIDFEKTFDSLEWKLLFKTLEAMNFGPMFRKWIRTFFILLIFPNNGFAFLSISSSC